MTPSLEAVIMKHWLALHRVISVIQSLCPAAGGSGPARGTSSVLSFGLIFECSSYITSMPSISLQVHLIIEAFIYEQNMY